MIDWSKVKDKKADDAEMFAEVIAMRVAAYRAESDPMRFELEFDALSSGEDPDLSAWIEKVKEIKDRYPKP